MESYFHTLKTELVHHRKYVTKADGQRNLFAFIEGFYNRMHAGVGWGEILTHGKFDYVTNTVKWDPAITNHTLPKSLYLTRKPAFFGDRYTWPSVDPIGATKLFTLPAKARYDAGTPFKQP